MGVNQSCLENIMKHITKNIMLTCDSKELKRLADIAVNVSAQLLEVTSYNDTNSIDEDDYEGYDIIEDENLAIRWVSK